MKNTNIYRKLLSLLCALLLAFSLMPSMFLQAMAEDLAVNEKISVESLQVCIDGIPIYEQGREVEHLAITLARNSILSFKLSWKMLGTAGKFVKDGDTFSIPIVTASNFKAFTLEKKELFLANGVHVATGSFKYENDVLSYSVVFNANASKWTIGGGTAKGFAEFSFTNETSEIPITINGTETVTYPVDYSKYQVDADIDGTVGRGEIALVKLNSEQGQDMGLVSDTDFASLTGIPNVEFEIYDTPDSQTPLLFESSGSTYTWAQTGESILKTDSRGKLKIADLEEGTYYLKELACAGYYTAQNQGVAFEIDLDESRYFVLNNVQRAVKLTKVAAGTATALAGAEFKLYTSDDVLLTGFAHENGYYVYTGENAVNQLSTAQNGILEVRGLDAGEYYFKETVAPNGYKLSADKYPFTLADALPDEETDYIFDIGNVENQPIPITPENPNAPVGPTIRINKKSMTGLTESDFDGVSFTVSGATNGYSVTKVTANGTVSFTLPQEDFQDSYTITETTPNGYLPIHPITFTVDQNGAVKGLAWNEADKHLIAWEQAALTFTIRNQMTPENPDNPNNPDDPDAPHKMLIYKIDSVTGVRLAGAKFRIRYPAGNIVEKTTNAIGLAEFELPAAGYAGEYTVTEFSAPTGYKLNATEVKFEIKADYSTETNGGYAHVLCVDTDLCIENVKDTGTPTSPGGNGGSSGNKSNNNGSDVRDKDRPYYGPIPTDLDLDEIEEPKYEKVGNNEIPLNSSPNPSTGADPMLQIAGALLAISGLAVCAPKKDPRGKKSK